MIILACIENNFLNNPKIKKLKLLVTKENDISAITKEHEYVRGLFNSKNSIYVAGANGDTRIALSLLLHECQHVADQHIYGKDTPITDKNSKIFANLKNQLKKRIKDIVKNNNINKIDGEIYSLINYAFSEYSLREQNAEILVKVPEILGYLGLDAGYQWLLVNEPGLLNFYETQFLPACKIYVTQKTQDLAISAKINPIINKVL